MRLRSQSPKSSPIIYKYIWTYMFLYRFKFVSLQVKMPKNIKPEGQPRSTTLRALLRILTYSCDLRQSQYILIRSVKTCSQGMEKVSDPFPREAELIGTLFAQEWLKRNTELKWQRKKHLVIDKSSYFPYAVPVISLGHTLTTILTTINNFEHLILKETSAFSSMAITICKLSHLTAWAAITQSGRLQTDTIFHTKSLSAWAAPLRHQYQQHTTISKWAAAKLINTAW